MTIPVKELDDGFRMPVFGMGTWTIGGKKTRDPENDDEKDARSIQYALGQGVTHIDTAESYAGGHTEELIGQAIKDHNRKKLFLTSKVAAAHLRYDEVLDALHASLKRLQTDYLDLYVVHQPNPDIPIAQAMKAMDRLVSEKLVKHIGVSNFTIQRFEEAQFYADNKLEVNQLHYSLIYREAQKKELVEYSENNDIFLIAYEPLERGQVLKKGGKLLDEMSGKYKKTPAQIAINWLISQANVVTISKTSDPDHLKENLGAIGWDMKPEDIETLKKDFPKQLTEGGPVPLI